MAVGVLALQGDFREHRRALERLGVESREVRLPHELEGLEALVIPGGESTTIGRLAVSYGLLEALRERARAGLPMWGTCAGMILLAREVGRDQPLVGVLDVRVERNAFGRQVDSFEADLDVPALDGLAAEAAHRPFHAVFIRAPVVRQAGPGVEVLARIPQGAVAVRQGHLLATAFHPELTADLRFHRYFLERVAGRRPAAAGRGHSNSR